jgi:hypothetical protein
MPRVLNTVLALTFMFFAGCALARGLIRTGMECSPSIVAGVQTAIQDGGSSWVSAVLSGLACVPVAIKNIEDEKRRESALSNSTMDGYETVAHKLQMGERMRVAQQLYNESRRD